MRSLEKRTSLTPCLTQQWSYLGCIVLPNLHAWSLFHSSVPVACSKGDDVQVESPGFVYFATNGAISSQSIDVIQPIGAISVSVSIMQR